MCCLSLLSFLSLWAVGSPGQALSSHHVDLELLPQRWAGYVLCFLYFVWHACGYGSLLETCLGELSH